MHSTVLRDVREGDAFSPLRLHLLASLLSLSPGRLLRYVVAEHGPRCASEPSKAFSPLMHAILLALVMPFSSPDEMPEESSPAPQSRKGTPKLSSAERPSLRDTHEHYESMRSVVVPRRSSSEEARSRSSSSHSSNDMEKDSSNSSWSGSSSAQSDSPEGEQEEESAGQVKRAKKRKTRMSPRRGFLQERSAGRLLRELAEPLLRARCVIAHSSGRKDSLCSSAERQQAMQLLPCELHSAAGVARLTNLCPPFVPLLLEALVKETVRGDVFGLAARHVFLRLLELAAPLFIAPHSAVLSRAVQRLVEAAVAALNVLEDPKWALEIGGTLVAVRLLHPSALRAQLERRAVDLARTPPRWRPLVALAYCTVTEQSLRLSLAAEPPGTLLDEAARASDCDHAQEAKGEPVRDMSATHVSVATSIEIAEGSVSGSPPPPGPCSRTGSSSCLINSSAALQWPFPARLPSAVTLPAVMITTCMVLCRWNWSKRTAAAIALWCLRAVVELPATPCAVALTHLMLKCPEHLADLTVRGDAGGSGGISGAGKNNDAPQTAFAQVQNSVVPIWTATATASLRFGDAVAAEACRLAEAALRRFARQRVDERLSGHFVDSDKEAAGAGEEEKGEEQERKLDDEVLGDLHDAQCYLMLLLQALSLRRGFPLSPIAQEELAALFACASRLRIAAGSFPRSPPGTPLPSRAAALCDEAFRAVARAVDVLLHDYAAGYPRRLCEALALLFSPRGDGAVAVGLRRAGAWDRHADCLESIAAAAAYAAARHSDAGHEAPEAALGRRGAVESAARSLAGELPCSGEPLRLGGRGGLAVAQQLWWARRAAAYLVEQWWRAHGEAVVRCGSDADGRSYLECCPHSI